MGKGGYNGGSTIIGQGSNWFSPPSPETERLHSIGKAEGEAALERQRAKDLARQKKIIAANEKLAKSLARRDRKIASTREILTASGKSTGPPQPGTKGAKSLEKSAALMKQVVVETRSSKRILNKPDGAKGRCG